MVYDLICFDLDGTLIDTASEIAEAANRALESHGIPRRPVADITMLIGAGTRELMLKLLARCFLDRPELAQTVQVDAVLHSLDAHYASTTGTSAMEYNGCGFASSLPPSNAEVKKLANHAATDLPQQSVRTTAKAIAVRMTDHV